MKDETDIKQVINQIHNYQTAATHQNPQYSSIQSKPNHLKQIEHDKPNNIMRRSTQYDSQISKQYAIMRTRNDTGYSSYQPSEEANNTNSRSYRLFITYLNNEQRQGEFIAYCVANKQSNSGIFSHQRFFVINSITKSFMYYSKIPDLPLTRVAQLKEPKEMVKLSKVSRFFYTPRPNSIGQVIVSWLDEEGKKEWHISMGSKKMVKEFGVILNQIKQKEKVTLKEVKQRVREASQTSRNFSSKDKDTPFIADIKNLQLKKENKSSSKIIYKAPLAAESSKVLQKKNDSLREIKKKQSKLELKNAQQQKQKNTKAVVNLSKMKVNRQNQQLRVQTQWYANQQQRKQLSRQNKMQQLINTSQYHLLEQQKTHRQQQPIHHTQVKYEGQQVASEEIQKFKQQLLVNSKQQPITNSNQQQVGVIQTSDKIQFKKEHSKLTSNRNIQQSQQIESKYMSNKSINAVKTELLILSQNQQKPVYDNKKVTSRFNFSQKQIKPQLQNLDNSQKEKAYRMTLLQQRRHKNETANRIKPVFNNISNRSRSQSMKKSQQSSSRFAKYQTQWILRWLLTKNKVQLAEVYCKFIDHCLGKVRAQIQNHQTSNIPHKAFIQLQNFKSEGVEYTYIKKFQQQQGNPSQDQVMMSRLRANSFLLSSIKFKQLKEIQIAVPLSCVVEWKGLKVFCEAALTGERLVLFSNSQIRLKYVVQLAHFQRLAKLSLKNAELLEIKLNDRHFIYFERASIFPKLNQYKVELDNHYISKYIEKGVIRAENDLQIITKHLQNNIIEQTLKTLQKEYFGSSIELRQHLEKQGLSLVWVDKLLALSLKSQNKRCISVCLGELITRQLVKHIRSRILLQSKGLEAGQVAIQTIYALLDDWLREKRQILEVIRLQLQKYQSCLGLDITNNFSQQYVLSSVLEELSCAIEIKARPDVEKIGMEGVSFWKEFKFTKNNVSITFTSKISIYSYEAFQQHFQILNQNLFTAQNMVTSDTFNKDVLLGLIAKKENSHYWQSQLFRLMSADQKIRVNQYLAYFQPYDSKEALFLTSPSYTYYSLKNNPTGYILTKQHFNTCLLGIKWLIKLQKYAQAATKLDEQLLRALIWCKSQPRLLIEIYDLKSQYSELVEDYQQSMKSGLFSLQTAISCFKESYNYCEIFLKCLKVADHHFKQYKFQKAIELYESADKFSSQMDAEEIKMLQCQELIEIYNRKTKMAMALCQMDKALEGFSFSLQKFDQYSAIFRDRKDIIQKIAFQEFNAYLLQLRCFQILADYSSILQLVPKVSKKFIEEDIQSSVQNMVKLQFTEFSRLKFIETMKYLWLAIIHNPDEFTNYRNDDSQAQGIILNKIVEYVKALRQSNRRSYRYSVAQVYKHFFAIIQNLNPAENSEQQSTSIFLNMATRSLRSLSKGNLNSKRCKIYDEDSKEDQLLVLQCLVHVIGYEFAEGTLMELHKQYLF